MVASIPALWLRDTLSLVLLYRPFLGVQRPGLYIFLRLARTVRRVRDMSSLVLL